MTTKALALASLVPHLTVTASASSVSIYITSGVWPLCAHPRIASSAVAILPVIRALSPVAAPGGDTVRSDVVSVVSFP